MRNRSIAIACVIAAAVISFLLSASPRQNPLPKSAAIDKQLSLSAICPAASGSEYEQAVVEALSSALRDAASSHQVEANLLLAVMAAESRCRPHAKSRAGAVGPMQLMPRTAKWLGVEDPHSLRDNIFGGAKYLAMMLRKFDGDLKLALAAYNAGPAAIKRHKGRLAYRETRTYVNRVLSYYERLRETSKTTAA